MTSKKIADAGVDALEDGSRMSQVPEMVSQVGTDCAGRWWRGPRGDGQSGQFEAGAGDAGRCRGGRDREQQRDDKRQERGA